jgi:hypothetical protein
MLLKNRSSSLDIRDGKVLKLFVEKCQKKCSQMVIEISKTQNDQIKISQSLPNFNLADLTKKALALLWGSAKHSILKIF